MCVCVFVACVGECVWFVGKRIVESRLWFGRLPRDSTGAGRNRQGRRGGQSREPPRQVHIPDMSDDRRKPVDFGRLFFVLPFAAFSGAAADAPAELAVRGCAGGSSAGSISPLEAEGEGE